jgi:hypothetical protein
MRFRLRAFLLHLVGSACALTLILGGLYLGWYRWPGWYLTGVLRILLLVLVVDLALGPIITLIIANPKKPRRQLARDITMVVLVQVVALIYGAATLWKGRPLYYTFSADRLELVQASDIEEKDALEAQRQLPNLAPHWYNRPRWVWAPLPEDPAEATRIVNATLSGGQDVIDMPRYFRPWNAGLPALKAKLSALGDMKDFSKPEQKTLTERMTRRGLNPAERNALVMWGGTSRRLLAVFDTQSLKIRALIKPD